MNWWTTEEEPKPSCYLIRSCDLPIKIKRPGVYRVLEDLSYRRQLGQSRAAITIASSRVVLQLDQFTLREACPTQGNLIGIRIKQNTEHIKILNGTIENFSLLGVFALGEINHLSLLHLTITGCGYKGYSTIPATPLVPTQVLSGAIGIFNVNTNSPSHDLTIASCHLDSNHSEQLAPPNIAVNIYALGIQGVNSLQIRDCTFNDNHARLLTNENTSPSLLPLCLTSCTGVNISHCQVAGNQGLNWCAVEPITLAYVGAVVVQNCSVQNTGCFNAPYTFSNSAIEILNVTDLLMEDCQVQDIAGVAPSDGLSFEVSYQGILYQNSIDLVFRRCVVQNVTYNNASANDFGAYGVLDNENNTNVTLDQCVVQNVSGGGNQGAFGFYLPEISNQYSVQDCMALNINNVSVAPQGTLSIGFLVGLAVAPSSVNYVMQRCTSENVSTVEGGTAYGVYTVLSQTGYISQCVALNCGNGFFLDAGTANFTLEGNEAANNSVSGFTDNSGNVGTTSTNIFKKNEASFNGGNNYVGVPETWVVEWSASGQEAPPSCSGLLNVSVM